MTDKQLDEVLEELGREHRAIGAPHSLQRVLYAAAESRKSALGKPRMQLPWAWAAAAILLALVSITGIILYSLHTHQNQTACRCCVPGASKASVERYRIATWTGSRARHRTDRSG